VGKKKTDNRCKRRHMHSIENKCLFVVISIVWKRGDPFFQSLLKCYPGPVTDV